MIQGQAALENYFVYNHFVDLLPFLVDLFLR